MYSNLSRAKQVEFHQWINTVQFTKGLTHICYTEINLMNGRKHFRHYQIVINYDLGLSAISDDPLILLMVYLIDNVVMTEGCEIKVLRIM
jgi:hypothetical protein